MPPIGLAGAGNMGGAAGNMVSGMMLEIQASQTVDTALKPAADMLDRLSNSFADITRRAGFSGDSISQVEKAFSDLGTKLPSVENMLSGIKKELSNIGPAALNFVFPSLTTDAAKEEEQLNNLRLSANVTEEFLQRMSKSVHNIVQETKGMFNQTNLLETVTFWRAQGVEIEDVILKLSKYSEMFDRVTGHERGTTRNFLNELRVSTGMSETKLAQYGPELLNAIFATKGIVPAFSPGAAMGDVSQLLGKEGAISSVIDPRYRNRALRESLAVSGALRTPGIGMQNPAGFLNRMLLAMETMGDTDFQRLAHVSGISNTNLYSLRDRARDGEIAPLMNAILDAVQNLTQRGGEGAGRLTQLRQILGFPQGEELALKRAAASKNEYLGTYSTLSDILNTASGTGQIDEAFTRTFKTMTGLVEASNNLMGTLKSMIGEEGLTGLKSALTGLNDVLSRAIGWWDGLSDAQQKSVTNMAGWISLIGAGAVGGMGALTVGGLLGGGAATIAAGATLIGSFLLLGAAIGGVVLAFENWDKILPVLKEGMREFGTIAYDVGDSLKNIFSLDSLNEGNLPNWWVTKDDLKQSMIELKDWFLGNQQKGKAGIVGESKKFVLGGWGEKEGRDDFGLGDSAWFTYRMLHGLNPWSDPVSDWTSNLQDITQNRLGKSLKPPFSISGIRNTEISNLDKGGILDWMAESYHIQSQTEQRQRELAIEEDKKLRQAIQYQTELQEEMLRALQEIQNNSLPSTESDSLFNSAIMPSKSWSP